MDERKSSSESRRSSSSTPTSINLRGSANSLTLEIKCDDPERLEMWANWLRSETQGIKSVVSEMTADAVNINHDVYFDKVARAA